MTPAAMLMLPGCCTWYCWWCHHCCWPAVPVGHPLVQTAVCRAIHQQLVSAVLRVSYKPGDQVYLCYGTHTNLELLELYGFMLNDNPHERSFLTRSTLEHVLHRQPVRATECFIHWNGHPSWELLRVLR